MIFMGDWREENGEYSVAGALPDITIVAIHRVDHQLEHRIDNRTRIFRIEIFLKLGRAFDIREQRRDRLALAFKVSDAELSAKRIGAEPDCFAAGAVNTARAAPQSPRNRFPVGLSAPHLGQRFASGASQSPQNFLAAGFSISHFEQRTRPPHARQSEQ